MRIRLDLPLAIAQELDTVLNNWQYEVWAKVQGLKKVNIPEALVAGQEHWRQVVAVFHTVHFAVPDFSRNTEENV